MAKGNDFIYWNLFSIENAIEKKQVSPIDVTKRLLEHIQKRNSELNHSSPWFPKMRSLRQNKRKKK